MLIIISHLRINRESDKKKHTRKVYHLPGRNNFGWPRCKTKKTIHSYCIVTNNSCICFDSVCYCLINYFFVRNTVWNVRNPPLTTYNQDKLMNSTTWIRAWILKRNVPRSWKSDLQDKWHKWSLCKLQFFLFCLFCYRIQFLVLFV